MRNRNEQNSSSQSFPAQSSRSLPQSKPSRQSLLVQDPRANKTKIIKKKKKYGLKHKQKAIKQSQSIQPEQSSIKQDYFLDKIQQKNMQQIKAKHSQQIPWKFAKSEAPTEKYKRLKKYFDKDVQQFFTTPTNKDIQQLTQIPKLLQIFNSSKKENKNIIDGAAVCRYLAIINQISNIESWIILDESNLQKYCCYYKDSALYMFQINEFEASLLEQRSKQIKQIDQLKLAYYNQSQSQNMSQLSSQVVFLFKNLKKNNHKLSLNCQKLLREVERYNQPNLEIKTSEDTTQPMEKYIKFLFRKLINKSAEIDEIKNYYSYFQHLEQIQLGQTDITQVEIDKKKFQRYLKKRNKKNSNKILPTGCLGCLSSFSEQFNPFIHCHKCFGRFHRICFQGSIDYKNQQNQVCNICQNCIDSLGDQKNTKNLECQLCGIQGLLTIKSQQGRVHLYCALMNNLWEINNKEIIVSPPISELILPQSTIPCSLCKKKQNYFHYCLNCQKKAHISCAYLAGWKIAVKKPEKAPGPLSIQVWCCGTDFNRLRVKTDRIYRLNYKNKVFSGRLPRNTNNIIQYI